MVGARGGWRCVGIVMPGLFAWPVDRKRLARAATVEQPDMLREGEVAPDRCGQDLLRSGDIVLETLIADRVEITCLRGRHIHQRADFANPGLPTVADQQAADRVQFRRFRVVDTARGAREFEALEVERTAQADVDQVGAPPLQDCRQSSPCRP